MSLSEAEYIELCKRQLEEKFSFGNGNGQSQKDLELLSNYIESKKGVSISLSTLKRLWKNEFKQGPQLATLNALVSVLDYEDWQHFRLQNKSVSQDTRRGRKLFEVKPRAGWGLVLLIIPIICAVYMLNLGDKKTSISIKGPVTFGVDKTLMYGVPNTAIFNYDVSNVVADSFFIQQSWNRWRREKIDPNKNTFSSIYYEPGFHRAKLIANDSILITQPVHILSDGWEPHVYHSESDNRFIDFRGHDCVGEGMFHIPSSLLEEKQVDVSRRFFTRVGNSKEFGISSSNFRFRTKVKVDQVSDLNCPWLIVQIVSEKHIFYVKLVRKGCERYAGYKIGEIVKGGKNSDLALLGCNVYDWQEIGIEVRDRNAEITINGQPVYTEVYQEEFGDIMSLSYIFAGKGSIDQVSLGDTQGRTVFADDFEEDL